MVAKSSLQMEGIHDYFHRDKCPRVVDPSFLHASLCSADVPLAPTEKWPSPRNQAGLGMQDEESMTRLTRALHWPRVVGRESEGSWDNSEYPPQDQRHQIYQKNKETL